VAVGHGYICVSSREGTCIDQLASVLADVDESTSAGDFGAETADIDVAVRVGLGQAEESYVEPATIIESNCWFWWMMASVFTAAPKS